MPKRKQHNSECDGVDTTSKRKELRLTNDQFFSEYPFQGDNNEFQPCRHREDGGLDFISTIFNNAELCLNGKSEKQHLENSRKKIGTLVDFITNESVCDVCRFFVDALRLRKNDYTLQRNVYSRQCLFLRFDSKPWYEKAGLITDGEERYCTYVWLEVGPEFGRDETPQPQICVARLSSSQLQVPSMFKDGVYPRRKPPIESAMGSCQLSIVREWLKECDERERCKAEPGNLTENVKLIDIETYKLVPYETHMRYVTLSYVWGKITTQQQYWNENNEYRLKGEVPPFEKLPRTMADALVVTQELGMNYLWIDVFCINQIDDVEMQRGIEALDSIFASSWLTIVCVDGPDSDYGLAGISRHLDRIRQPWLKTRDGVLMATYIHSQSAYNGESAWDQRAWTLQERLLSRRCLFFNDDHFSMQCEEVTFHDLIGPAFTNQGVIWPPLDFRLNETTYWANGSGLNIDSESWSFNTYAKLVSVYTGRELSDHTDIHNACWGSLQRMTQKTGYEFHFGLPKDDLVRSLSWIPHYDVVQKRRSGFPSWSWLGWVGGSKYPDWLSDKQSSSIPLGSDPAQEITDKTRQLQITRAPISRVNAEIKHDPTMAAPVIQLKTTSCTFAATAKELYDDCGQKACDLWTLRRSNGRPLPNKVCSHQNMHPERHVSFCLTADQSKEVKKRDGKVNLISLQHWPAIESENSIISALVVLQDRTGTYQRLACVALSEEEWTGKAEEASVFTLV